MLKLQINVSQQYNTNSRKMNIDTGSNMESWLSTFESCHDKTNIVRADQHGSRPTCASAQYDQDPCCSVSLLVIEYVSEQHGSWSDYADAQAAMVWIHAGRKPITLVLYWRGSFSSGKLFVSDVNMINTII
jgi:hypothetical protein